MQCGRLSCARIRGNVKKASLRGLADLLTQSDSYQVCVGGGGLRVGGGYHEGLFRGIPVMLCALQRLWVSLCCHSAGSPEILGGILWDSLRRLLPWGILSCPVRSNRPRSTRKRHPSTRIIHPKLESEPMLGCWSGRAGTLTYFGLHRAQLNVASRHTPESLH